MLKDFFLWNCSISMLRISRIPEAKRKKQTTKIKQKTKITSAKFKTMFRPTVSY